MKILKYLTVILAAALAATGCYDDKGSYYTGSWTDIAAVEGMSIPGIGTNYYLNLVEEETLSLNPTVRFKPGVDESLFTYDWVMGGDTIASGLKLNWTVMRTNKMEFNQSGQTSFWLAINNKKSGENWRYYLQNDAGNLLKVTIAQVMAPKVGVFVYEKEDGSVEWGSVKGANAGNSGSLYNALHRHICALQRPLQNGRIRSRDRLRTVHSSSSTPIKAGHGAMVQTSEASTNPWDFPSAPSAIWYSTECPKPESMDRASTKETCRKCWSAIRFSSARPIMYIR